MLPVQFGRMIAVSGEPQTVKLALERIAQKAREHDPNKHRNYLCRVLPVEVMIPPHSLLNPGETVTGVITTSKADEETFIRIARESQVGFPMVDAPYNSKTRERAPWLDLLERLRPHFTQTLPASQVDDNIEV